MKEYKWFLNLPIYPPTIIQHYHKSSTLIKTMSATNKRSRLDEADVNKSEKKTKHHDQTQPHTSKGYTLLSLIKY